MDAQTEWRFFTRPVRGEGVVADVWYWARLDDAGNVAESSGGFHTILAAMYGARQHGFDGRIEVGDPDLLLAQFGDRRAFWVQCQLNCGNAADRETDEQQETDRSAGTRAVSANEPKTRMRRYAAGGGREQERG
jgi:hypothetical protein